MAGDHLFVMHPTNLKVPKTHCRSAEHRWPHSKQDDGSTTSGRRAGGTRYLTTRDPLHHQK